MRSARIFLLTRAGLPAEIAGLICDMVEDAWLTEKVVPMARAYREVAAVKTIVLPLPGLDTYFLDLDEVGGYWDDSRQLRNTAILYSHCRFVQRVLTSSNRITVHPLVGVIWDARKEEIVSKFLRGRAVMKILVDDLTGGFWLGQ